MDWTSSFHKTVSSHVDLPSDRWISVEDAATLDVSKFDSAVIFILAVWSGPAVAMLKVYSRALSTVEPRDVPLVVINIDSLTGRSSSGFPPDLTHGIGETYFIKGGLVADSIVTLLREEKETVLDFPHGIDLSASSHRFLEKYAKVFPRSVI